MDSDKAIGEIKTYFDSLYEDVSLRGTGAAKFVVIGKGPRGAVISVGKEGWFVELWSQSDLHPDEETVVKEEAIPQRDEAIQMIRSWLDG
jgi:hypothetical protein